MSLLHPLSFIQTSFLILQIVIILFAIIPQFKAANNETDYMALLAIKTRLIDDGNRVLSSWNHSLHHCSWEGVTCEPKHNRVINLDLAARGLWGTISPFIGNLTFLTYLGLDNNSLSSHIPPELGRLYSLKSIHLNDNSLTGEIPPNISGWINLKQLDLSVNNLQGQLPKGLGALSNLTKLWVQSNQFSGPFFTAIANLTTLEDISCYDNAFTGSIPNHISEMTKLRVLDLALNNFSGVLPPSIFNLTSLQGLYFEYNKLHGSIPQDIGSRLSHLQKLALSNNYFSGSLPISLQNLTHLQTLDLGDNNFTGSVSLHFRHLPNLQLVRLVNNNFVGNINLIIPTLVNCSNLRTLDLSLNKFNGVLPKIVANLSTSMVDLWLGGNQLSGGIIPKGISNLINLRNLELTESKLKGSIPELGKLQKLEILYLEYNKLTGEIPSSLQNLSYLSRLRLHDNHLQGSVPPNLGNCVSLLFLNLYNNSLKGPLPKELFGGSAQFVELDLSQNRFKGSLPDEISKQSNLLQFDVSNNKLSGEIPPLFGNLFSLQKLNMKDNLLHGSVPSSFANLKSLVEVDLSKNDISGPIPEYFSDFSLIYLNLSYNNFEGKVPTTGVYANASAVSVVGNNRLCGGIPELHLQRCMDKQGKKRTLSHALMLALLIFGAIAGVLALPTSAWLYLHCRTKIRKHHVSTHSMVKTNPAILKVSCDMLLKATDRFALENFLGSGTFGSVYKGILDGNTVAVKVLNLQHRGGSKSFMAECRALRNVRHRNLVRMITACSSTDFQRNDFKALVYEFMPNGSLDRWLHEEGDLSLLQRVDIAIDVAHALNHLHHECDNTIVHCDLKPNNILLDEDFVAHVADFGLAKVLTQPIHPNQSSSIGVRGTVGYAAPEYGMGGDATLEADLYSYGILLLELMTRIRPTDDVFHEDFNLHMYAKAALPDQVSQIVDSKLAEDDHVVEDVDAMCMGPRTPERLQQREKCIKIVLEIGVACSDQLPHKRMKMSAVISQLQHAKNIILKHETRRNLAKGARS